MKSRYMPSAEYRQKLRDRHILEVFSLVDAACIFALVIVYALDISRSLWVPEMIVAAGGLMNAALAVRGILVKSWLQAVALAAASIVCFVLLAYVNWT